MAKIGEKLWKIYKKCLFGQAFEAFKYGTGMGKMHRPCPGIQLLNSLPIRINIGAGALNFYTTNKSGDKSTRMTLIYAPLEH
jgi:hypothetical protein